MVKKIPYACARNAGLGVVYAAVAPRRAALILAHTKLVLIAKECRKIRDIQRAQSSSWIVAVASGVEPVVAMLDRVQRRVRAGVGLTGLCQLIDRRV